MLIGVLALQGAFREHRMAIKECGVDSIEVRKRQELEQVDGLIIPGGESTTMGRLLIDYDLMEPIQKKAAAGMPIYGTCAGLVLLAKEIEGSNQPRLGLMEMEVKRNAFGRQVDSFEADLQIPALGDTPFRGVFIRAPYITRVGPEIEVLAKYDDKIIFARQGQFLASAFHPELTKDLRIHKYFLKMVEEATST
ncbi:pyridoxal 5'-phosphate synthase glutaminase subunit PdxT [Calderihabitans maritimus]|uniref:Pyridoxal 5'-phosphate synthase subunit PdxT n=1 Tax=Calderihabitans maritimus TaxID=1246530 RepID=A0A1Z5HWD1_9FIRM|nr:pyridoxal 5'-phosphate synthase glutaminase subunit PdxT [Calderihabitans maritimus]GAW93641.1 glutamine amidotransferase [Calderihabitans maritimus]